jgi:hypothetical protein
MIEGASMNVSTPPQLPLRSPKVILIGAGMTGILMTIKLREAGTSNPALWNPWV